MVSYQRAKACVIVAALYALVVSHVLAIEPRHVVVVVWDGMRPDFVSEEHTPVLWKLAHDGVTFRNHHAVYPSATNVNGTALATGVYPGHSGMIANHVYRSDIDAKKSVDVEASAVVRKGDELSNGKYVGAPTVAELVHQSGGRTVIATAKTIGLLLDRHVDVSAKGSVAMFSGVFLPPESGESVSKSLGPFPGIKVNQFGQCDDWTTKALTDFFWKTDVPAYSVLWLSEPDGSQHSTAPGAPAALAALKSSDENLGRVLAALDRHHAREASDIFVVSDHGFSTISRQVDLPKILKDAGFHVVTEFAEEPKAGDVMMVGNGGSVLFYVTGHDAGVTRRLVEFLQQSDFAGVIFARGKMEGTFAFDDVKIDNQTDPDVMMAFRWRGDKNQFGVPGMIDADWQRKAGEGTHATLSRFDMHNTLIAAGPDFQKGLTNDLPSGNVDLAPTILKILGINSAAKMDGRVLSEAMMPGNDRAKTESNELIAVKTFPTGKWRQTLKVSRVGTTAYFDEGDGVFVPKR